MLIEQRDSLKGEISVPGDKSISHRAIVLGSIAKGITEIDGLLMGEDCLSTIDCFRKMHTSIEILSNNRVKVKGNGLFGLNPPSTTLNTGRSGTSLRLILGILSAQPFNSTIIREESVMKKNVGKTVQLLKNMGASIAGKDNGNYCPLKISPSSLSGISQVLQPYDTHIKSPLLLSGLYADGETIVKEVSKSRDHTELMLKHFGAEVKVDGLTVSTHKTDNLYAQHVTVPGDISFAAYFITAGLLTPNSDITITNIGINPTRTGIIDVYKKMGAKIEIYNERIFSNEKVADIRVTTSNLQATTIEGDDIPRLFDEIPVIAVAATQAKGSTLIKDIAGFKLKKSGKITHLINQLHKMGASIRETDDGMIIEGGKSLRGTVVESANDNTIALALSVAGLIADGETMIRKAQIVDVMFPEYLSILNTL